MFNDFIPLSVKKGMVAQKPGGCWPWWNGYERQEDGSWSDRESVAQHLGFVILPWPLAKEDTTYQWGSQDCAWYDQNHPKEDVALLICVELFSELYSS